MSDQDNIHLELNQLLTYSEVAAEKAMGQSLLAYHIAKPDAPKPVFIGRGKHRFYRAADVAAWQPNRSPSKGRKKHVRH